MARNAVASTSRSASSDEDEDDAARKRRKKDVKRARKQQKKADDDIAAEALELARDITRRAREQAQLEMMRKRKSEKRSNESSSDSDGDNGIEIVPDEEEEEEAPVRRKRKKVKRAASDRDKGKVEDQKEKKKRGRAPKLDETSSEEESLVAAVKRTNSLTRSREGSAVAPRTNSSKPISDNRTAASTSNAKTASPLKPATKPSSASAKPGVKVSSFVPVQAKVKRPSLSVDTEPRFPSASSSTLRDSAQSPPASSAKTGTTNRKTSLSTSSSTNKEAGAGSPRLPPLRIWTPAGARDVSLPLQLSLDFDIVVPTRKGKEKEEIIPAKVESLAEVNALLEFALARRKLDLWSSIDVQRARRDDGKGPWVVTISLAAPGQRSVKLVEVTASAKPAVGQAAAAAAAVSEKEADRAELGGKMDIIRALVKPSSAPPPFLSAINPRPVAQTSDDLGFAESDDEGEAPSSKVTSETRQDSEGKELFRLFKTLHPRKALPSIERRLKSVGDLEFADLCKELLETLQSGVVDLGDGVMQGFGRWTGDMATSLKAALGHIHRFCMAPHHAYLDLSVSTVSAILDLCIGANGGADAETWINSWLQRLEKDNAEVEADYARRGVPKPTPKTLPPAPKRIPTAQSAPRPAPQQSPPPIAQFVVDAVKHSRQDEPSVDPRAAAKRLRLEMAQSAPPPSMPSPSAPPEPPLDDFASVSAPPESLPAVDRLSASPAPASKPTGLQTAVLQPSDIKQEAMVSAHTARRTTMSPLVGRAPSAAAAAVATRASPTVTRASPTVTRASPTVTRASPSSARDPSLTTRATPSSSRPSSFVSASVTPALPWARSIARPVSAFVSGTRIQQRQPPTPEPTPEAEAKGLSRGPILLERDSVLLEPQPIADGRSLVPFSFDLVDQLALTRLHEVNRDDKSLELGQLPLRAKVIFTRTADDGAAWPSISINFNQLVIPSSTTGLVPGSFMSASHSFDVSRLVQSGVNNLNLARWKSDHLPADLRLSVELFRAVPEPWLRANIEEDERVYTLYADRAKAPVPLGVSLIDPTDPISNRRIVTPVRGTSCRHLETFDLDIFLSSNLKQDVSDWRCPVPSCREYAPPSSLVTCSWHAGALASVGAGINMLEVTRLDEEEAKPLMNVKEEQQPVE